MKFAVIFDMDGVLIDLKYVEKSLCKAFKSHGISFTEKEMGKYNGISLRDLLKTCKELYGINIDIEAFRCEANEVQNSMMKNVKVNKNLLRLLKELKENDISMGVGTSSMRQRAIDIIKLLKIENYFSALVSANDVSKHKPDPEIFLTVAKRLNTKPKSCVVVEDAPSGLEAAKRGRMKSIGLITQYHTRKDLSGANLIVNGFSELSLQKINRIFN